jgi:hypothetical protein
MALEPNRKTNIPVKSIPAIVEWLLKNCNKGEVFFMASLARDRTKFALLNSIFTRLTDKNVYDVFYDGSNMTAEQLQVFRAAKRGEVAGLKAFAMACQQAREEIAKRERLKDEDED